jgi:hypothetical protein
MPVSTPSRTQPPAIQDPKEGKAELWTLGREDEDESPQDDMPDWVKRAKDAYQFSTSYVDSNYRKGWEDSINAFNSEHAQDSKYNTDLFRKRSRIYRPKTRAIIRKNEAAAAAAFFSNLDRTSISAVDQSNIKERVSADVLQAILQYRLTKTVPWFQIVQGGLQDAQVQGATVAHIYWSYVAKNKEKGQVEVLEDKPVIDLRPIENIRFDPAASWIDPINTSPYVIDLIPMYVCDVKARMDRPDPKGKTWKNYDDSVLFNCMGDDDPTRQARNQGKQDATRQNRPISDYDIIWVHRHIHRLNGTDYEFYMLKSEYLLTDPEPLKNSVFHGERPYVLGVVNLETHKVIPNTVPQLGKGLQEEMNENVNQRLDNVKLVMNKRYFAKRGKNVDMASLVRNVPAGITLMDDVEGDVKVVDYQDVTQSAYLEQDRLNMDFDELLGNFSAAAVQLNKPGQTSTGMMLAQAPANLLTEYMLKTYVETFVQPVLRHIVLLEQYYETDNMILYLAGQKAQLMQKYGQDRVTDDMLEHEVTVTVNVGMGATDPVAKLQRFGFAINLLIGIAKSKVAIPFLQLQEVAKEIFGLSGYQDGTRFMVGEDPDKIQAQAQMMQLMKIVQQLQLKLKDKSDANMAKIQVGREKNQKDIIMQMMRSDHEIGTMLADYILNAEKQMGKEMPGNGQTPPNIQ